MADNPIIMYDSPEAAECIPITLRDGTTFDLWVSRHNGSGWLYYSLDEHVVRNHGATHKLCPVSGEAIPVSCRLSESALDAENAQKWKEMEQATDPGHGFFLGNDYYDCIEDVCDEIGFRYETLDRAGFRPVWAEPVYLPTIYLSDIFCDYTHEDNLEPWPEEAERLVSELNKVCEGEIAYYTESKTRPDDDTVDAWWAEIEEHLEGSNG